MVTIGILATAASIWSTVWPILAAIAIFLFFILIHELGHFLAAKLMGVRVNEFSIGFGPKMFSFGKGETKYSVRWLPLGGYCAMEGEDDDSEDNKAFGKKPVWRRIIITVAGALFNILLGFIIVVIMTAATPVIGTTTVAQFNEDAVSPSYGLMEGDKIISVNGSRVFVTDDITYYAASSADGNVQMQVKRDGEVIDLDIQFGAENGYPALDFKVARAEKNIGTVISYSFWDSISMMRMIYSSIGGMLTGQYGLDDMAGPVGMVQQVSQAAAYGLDTFLWIAALITINLGIFNLLPIPGLDGGRLLFLIREGIARRPGPKKYEAYIHLAGLALLLVLSVVLIFHDFFRIFTGG